MAEEALTLGKVRERHYLLISEPKSGHSQADQICGDTLRQEVSPAVSDVRLISEALLAPGLNLLSQCFLTDGRHVWCPSVPARCLTSAVSLCHSDRR